MKDEKNIILSLHRKDKAAAELFYDRYASNILGVIEHMVRDRALAEDLSQEVMMKAWNKFDQYDETKGRFFTWLLNLTRNHVIDYLRIKKNQTRKSQVEINPETQGGTSEMKIEHVGIKEIVERLQSDQQEVIEGLYFQGYSQSELAEKLDIPLGTIKSRARLALKKLKGMI